MKSVTKTMLAGAAVLIAAGPVLAASSGKLSWFDDTPFAGVGALGVPEVQLRNPAEYSSFDINLYRSQRNMAAEAYPQDNSESRLGISSVQVYGEVESGASLARYSSFNEPVNNRVNAFGLKWQHRLDTINSFAVSAEYGEGTTVYPSSVDTLDTRAAFSWTSRLPMTMSPSITGSVFLGDEMAREDIYRHLGRKYYGFTVGGSVTLFQSHTPYVSFKMQKSLYDNTADEPLVVSPRSSDRSLLSAGWKWQVQRDFSLQAEASYGFSTTPTLDPNATERSRILFGTRFDFK